jgi:SAM-dependent methyltransferase
VLDVGCGPFSLLRRLGLEPLGLDRCEAHARSFRAAGSEACVGAASALPFAAKSFDAVVSLGLLHHLHDDEARLALGEMRRVARPRGTILVFDAVLPEPAWRRPLAWLIRRGDRGRFMRNEAELAALLASIGEWRSERFTYAGTGLEGLLCVRHQ